MEGMAENGDKPTENKQTHSIDEGVMTTRVIETWSPAPPPTPAQAIVPPVVTPPVVTPPVVTPPVTPPVVAPVVPPVVTPPAVQITINQAPTISDVDKAYGRI